MLVALKAVVVIAQAITLRGIVEDSAQRGIPYATALFVSLDRTATTNVAGRFEFRLEAGTYLVRMRRSSASLISAGRSLCGRSPPSTRAEPQG